MRENLVIGSKLARGKSQTPKNRGLRSPPLVPIYSPTGVRHKMTKPGKLQRAAVVAVHAVVGWAYCGALVGVGRQFLSMHTTLVLHAIGAPVGFALISLFYYRKYAFTRPMQTAAAFLSVVLALDLFLVAPVFKKSYAMFSSVLGTWMPFVLIFAVTYLVGRLTLPKSPPPIQTK
jgi:hypothetical protein